MLKTKLPGFFTEIPIQNPGNHIFLHCIIYFILFFWTYLLKYHIYLQNYYITVCDGLYNNYIYIE